MDRSTGVFCLVGGGLPDLDPNTSQGHLWFLDPTQSL